MGGNFTEIPHINKRRFLNAFADRGGVRRAAQEAGVTWKMHYHWLKVDPDYVAAFEEATIMAGDVLEDEAVRRAHDGVDEPVFYKGQVCGAVRKYSDPLLMFLLKGNKPEKFAERRDITSGGSPLRLTIAGNADSI